MTQLGFDLMCLESDVKVIIEINNIIIIIDTFKRMNKPMIQLMTSVALVETTSLRFAKVFYS